MDLADKIKIAVDSCEFEGKVNVPLRYDELAIIYSLLVAKSAYENTITQSLENMVKG